MSADFRGELLELDGLQLAIETTVSRPQQHHEMHISITRFDSIWIFLDLAMENFIDYFPTDENPHFFFI